jgi:hypothetical protein
LPVTARRAFLAFLCIVFKNNEKMIRSAVHAIFHAMLYAIHSSRTFPTGARAMSHYADCIRVCASWNFLGKTLIRFAVRNWLASSIAFTPPVGFLASAFSAVCIFVIHAILACSRFAIVAPAFLWTALSVAQGSALLKHILPVIAVSESCAGVV